MATPVSRLSHRTAIPEEAVVESAEILEKAFSQLYLEGDIVCLPPTSLVLFYYHFLLGRGNIFV